MPTEYAGDATVWVSDVPIPADGEGASERIFAPAWRKEADRSAYLYRKLPTVHTYAYDDAGVVYWTYANSYALETTETAAADALGYLEVPNCVVGDKIVVDCFLNWRRTGANATVNWDAWLDAIDAQGAAGEVQTHIPGTHWEVLGVDADLLATNQPLSLTGVWTVTVAGTTRFTFALDSDDWSTDTFKIYSSFNLSAIRYPA